VVSSSTGGSPATFGGGRGAGMDALNRSSMASSVSSVSQSWSRLRTHTGARGLLEVPSVDMLSAVASLPLSSHASAPWAGSAVVDAASWQPVVRDPLAASLAKRSNAAAVLRVPGASLGEGDVAALWGSGDASAIVAHGQSTDDARHVAGVQAVMRHGHPAVGPSSVPTPSSADRASIHGRPVPFAVARGGGGGLRGPSHLESIGGSGHGGLDGRGGGAASPNGDVPSPAMASDAAPPIVAGLRAGGGSTHPADLAAAWDGLGASVSDAARVVATTDDEAEPVPAVTRWRAGHSAGTPAPASQRPPSHAVGAGAAHVRPTAEPGGDSAGTTPSHTPAAHAAQRSALGGDAAHVWPLRAQGGGAEHAMLPHAPGAGAVHRTPSHTAGGDSHVTLPHAPLSGESARAADRSVPGTGAAHVWLSPAPGPDVANMTLPHAPGDAAGATPSHATAALATQRRALGAGVTHATLPHAHGAVAAPRRTSGGNAARQPPSDASVPLGGTTEFASIAIPAVLVPDRSVDAGRGASAVAAASHVAAEDGLAGSLGLEVTTWQRPIALASSAASHGSRPAAAMSAAAAPHRASTGAWHSEHLSLGSAAGSAASADRDASLHATPSRPALGSTPHRSVGAGGHAGLSDSLLLLSASRGGASADANDSMRSLASSALNASLSPPLGEEWLAGIRMRGGDPTLHRAATATAPSDVGHLGSHIALGFQSHASFPPVLRCSLRLPAALGKATGTAPSVAVLLHRDPAVGASIVVSRAGVAVTLTVSATGDGHAVTVCQPDDRELFHGPPDRVPPRFRRLHALLASAVTTARRRLPAVAWMAGDGVTSGSGATAVLMDDGPQHTCACALAGAAGAVWRSTVRMRRGVVDVDGPAGQRYTLLLHGGSEGAAVRRASRGAGRGDASVHTSAATLPPCVGRVVAWTLDRYPLLMDAFDRLPPSSPLPVVLRGDAEEEVGGGVPLCEGRHRCPACGGGGWTVARVSADGDALAATFTDGESLVLRGAGGGSGAELVWQGARWRRHQRDGWRCEEAGLVGLPPALLERLRAVRGFA
jgi:hypothetical protein